MAPSSSEPTPGRLERIAPRTRKLLGLDSSATATAQETSMPRRGPPDEVDQSAIANRIKLEIAGRQPDGSAFHNGDEDAEKIAALLVARARGAVDDLNNGASDGSLSDADHAALEAVLFMRGRPALNVEGDRIETIDPVKHPGSGFWRTFVQDHETNLVRAANATGAVVVRDRAGSMGTWVAGTAWLVKPYLVVTNRHVLFPSPPGVTLAQRSAESETRAQFTSNLEVTIDFALDDGIGRNLRYTVLDAPFVAAANDPVDVALVRVEPVIPAVQLPQPLAIAATAPVSKYLYVVGHPGKISAAELTSRIQVVFGTPNGRKRISLGEMMSPDPASPRDMLHDASTIGGYSGGCVLGFDTCEVAALHYHGTYVEGNRAILAQALRAHPLAAYL